MRMELDFFNAFVILQVSLIETGGMCGERTIDMGTAGSLELFSCDDDWSAVVFSSL